jgi:hypothetical protein
MDLEKLYNQVDKAVSSLDPGSIWPGFEPLKFALYDEERCFFDGRYIEKTDAFCANTSIVYEGEQIAIWMVQEEPDISVLTSKIVHEMFHGYQNRMGWDCWPDELDALYRYRYDAENLTLRLRENELLLALADRFDGAAMRELLALRKRRSLNCPYEFSYESRVEEIEGTANYVEWQVLRQLDESAADALVGQMRAVMTEPENLFPIRISGYFTGALMMNALIGAGVRPFEAAERPMIRTVLRDVEPSDGLFPEKAAVLRRVTDAVEAYREETASIIRSALEKGPAILNGPLALRGVNVYDARCLDGFITSTYFVMVRDREEDRVLRGDFVIKMQDEETVAAVYRRE